MFNIMQLLSEKYKPWQNSIVTKKYYNLSLINMSYMNMDNCSFHMNYCQAQVQVLCHKSKVSRKKGKGIGLEGRL